jgi:hypothetical protein
MTTGEGLVALLVVAAVLVLIGAFRRGPRPSDRRGLGL